jgi:hypothetical protein
VFFLACCISKVVQSFAWMNEWILCIAVELFSTCNLRL